LKHGEDIPALQGDFKEGDRVMYERVIIRGTEYWMRKKKKPSQLKHAN